MRVTVVFPKAGAYDGKGVDTQRIYSAVIKKYLQMLKNANCKIEYFLEDKLAADFIQMFDFEDVKVVTCLSQSDITFFDKFRDMVDLLPYMYERFAGTENFSGDVEKKFSVPITLLREDREAYINKRLDAYRKRLRTATDEYLLRRKAVLMFRMDNNMDRTTALRDTVIQGDGRLCIESNLNSNVALVYYGGTYLTEDNLPMILSL